MAKRSGRLSAIPPAVHGALFIAGLVLTIEAVVRASIVSKWVLPSPGEIAVAIWELHLSGALLGALYPTMKAVALCAILVIGVGVLVGYLLYRYPVAGEAYSPLLGSLFAIPLILFFPIFLVIFGRNYMALTACAFLHCVLPVIIYTREALTRVPAVFLKVGATFNVSDPDCVKTFAASVALRVSQRGLKKDNNNGLRTRGSARAVEHVSADAR